MSVEAITIGETTDSFILCLLAKYPFLSAKQIHEQLKKETIGKISYHAAYKTIKRLCKRGILQRGDVGYSLSKDWINSVCSFADIVNNRKTMHKKEPISDAHATTKLDITQYRFMPFWLGKPIKIEHGNSNFSDVKTEEGVLYFKFGNCSYTWFPTGICVQQSQAKPPPMNIISSLMYRREDHLSILDGSSDVIHEIKMLEKLVNSRQKRKVTIFYEYVLSVFHIERDSSIPKIIFDNLMKMLVHRDYLGIDDSSSTEIRVESINFITERLKNMYEKPLHFSSIIDISSDKDRIVYASWGGVVFSTAKEYNAPILSKLMKLETNLQHMWFLMYTFLTKSDSMKKTNNIMVSLSEIKKTWTKFTTTDATEDYYYLTLKDGLIKTSRILRFVDQLQEIKEIN